MSAPDTESEFESNMDAVKQPQAGQGGAGKNVSSSTVEIAKVDLQKVKDEETEALKQAEAAEAQAEEAEDDKTAAAMVQKLKHVTKVVVDAHDLVEKKEAELQEAEEAESVGNAIKAEIVEEELDEAESVDDDVADVIAEPKPAETPAPERFGKLCIGTWGDKAGVCALKADGTCPTKWQTSCRTFDELEGSLLENIQGTRMW